MDTMKRDVKHEKDFSYISPSHIRAARGWLGWNLDETSEKTGLSKKTISRYEVGRHDITHASAAKVYAAFLNNGVELAPDGLRSK